MLRRNIICEVNNHESRSQNQNSHWSRWRCRRGAAWYESRNLSLLCPVSSVAVKDDTFTSNLHFSVQTKHAPHPAINIPTTLASHYCKLTLTEASLEVLAVGGGGPWHQQDGAVILASLSAHAFLLPWFAQTASNKLLWSPVILHFWVCLCVPAHPSSACAPSLTPWAGSPSNLPVTAMISSRSVCPCCSPVGTK